MVGQRRQQRLRTLLLGLVEDLDLSEPSVYGLWVSMGMCRGESREERAELSRGESRGEIRGESREQR
jgi:hypothetical protein